VNIVNFNKRVIKLFWGFINVKMHEFGCSNSGSLSKRRMLLRLNIGYGDSNHLAFAAIFTALFCKRVNSDKQDLKVTPQTIIP